MKAFSFVLLSIFLIISCDQFEKPKLNEATTNAPKTDTGSNSNPVDTSNCLNDCWVKDAYYKVQLNRIEYEYEKDSSLQSPLYDTLIAITKDLRLKCNCWTLHNCPRCKEPEDDCCIPADCAYADCIEEMIRRPDCFRAQYEIEFFRIINKNGDIVANANTSSSTLDQTGFHIYNIVYTEYELSEIYTVEFKEKNFDIVYSVKIISN